VGARSERARYFPRWTACSCVLSPLRVPRLSGSPVICICWRVGTHVLRLVYNGVYTYGSTAHCRLTEQNPQTTYGGWRQWHAVLISSLVRGRVRVKKGSQSLIFHHGGCWSYLEWRKKNLIRRGSFVIEPWFEWKMRVRSTWCFTCTIKYIFTICYNTSRTVK
jgi:hypothetical protein